jgi:hypothetical protein
MLTPGGQITGMPVAQSSGNITFQVTDGFGVTVEKTLFLTISP